MNPLAANTLLVIVRLFGSHAFEVSLQPGLDNAQCVEANQPAHGTAGAQVCDRDEVIAKWVAAHDCEALDQSVDDIADNGVLLICHKRGS